MGKFRRLCILLYALILAVGVGFLAVEYVGYQPLLTWIQPVAAQPWFYILYDIVLGIIFLGAVVLLLRGLFTPGRGGQLRVNRPAGTVVITRQAVQSTVRYVVESNPGLTLKNVKIRIRNGRTPRVWVRLKVNPGTNAALAPIGRKLQDEVSTEVGRLTGATIKRVDVMFTGKGPVGAAPAPEFTTAPEAGETTFATNQATGMTPVSAWTAPSPAPVNAVAAEPAVSAVSSGAGATANPDNAPAVAVARVSHGLEAFPRADLGAHAAPVVNAMPPMENVTPVAEPLSVTEVEPVPDAALETAPVSQPQASAGQSAGPLPLPEPSSQPEGSEKKCAEVNLSGIMPVNPYEIALAEKARRTAQIEHGDQEEQADQANPASQNESHVQAGLPEQFAQTEQPEPSAEQQTESPLTPATDAAFPRANPGANAPVVAEPVLQITMSTEGGRK